VQLSSPMVWGWRLCTWLGCPQAADHGRGQSHLAPWLTPTCQLIYLQEGVSDLARMYIGYRGLTSTGINTPHMLTTRVVLGAPHPNDRKGSVFGELLLISGLRA
jgi:hypothetical protein